MPQQRRGSWSSSEKPAARLRPGAIAAPLGGHARVFLFCLASDTDWEGVGVTHATAHQMFVRGLVDRDQTGGRFKLTGSRTTTTRRSTTATSATSTTSTRMRARWLPASTAGPSGRRAAAGQSTNSSLLKFLVLRARTSEMIPWRRGRTSRDQ
jgi:hypothetical protein